MNVLRARRTHRRNIETLENVQDLQCGYALPIRRQLVNIPATIICRHRRHPLRAMCGKIFVTQQATVLGHVGIDSLCDITLIKSVPASFNEHLIGFGKTRVAEHLAFRRRLPIRHVGLGKSRVLAQYFRIRRHTCSDNFRNRKTVFRIGNGRRQHIGHWQSAISPMQFEPTVNGTRHTYRQRTGIGDGAETVFFKIAQSHQRRRTPRCV